MAKCKISFKNENMWKNHKVQDFWKIAKNTENSKVQDFFRKIEKMLKIFKVQDFWKNWKNAENGKVQDQSSMPQCRLRLSQRWSRWYAGTWKRWSRMLGQQKLFKRTPKIGWIPCVAAAVHTSRTRCGSSFLSQNGLSHHGYGTTMATGARHKENLKHQDKAHTRRLSTRIQQRECNPGGVIVRTRSVRWDSERQRNEKKRKRKRKGWKEEEEGKKRERRDERKERRGKRKEE